MAESTRVVLTKDTDVLLRWMYRTGQLVWINGRIVLWRRYKGSCYDSDSIRRVYALAHELGIEVRE